MKIANLEIPIFNMSQYREIVLLPKKKESKLAHAIRCLLSKVAQWDFNVFSLDKVCSGRTLLCLGMHLLSEHRLIRHFRLDPTRLMHCLYTIETGYHESNHYHNALHAADVTQAMHCYLIEKKLKQCLRPIEVLGSILAAVSHDLDHPGVNQAFLIATANPLASLYENCSVLENHHWRSSIAIIRETGVFSHFSAAEWNQIEALIRDLIMATDMSLQQDFLSKFRNHIAAQTLNLNDADHRTFVLQIALKCADICNPCRNWELCESWADRVCQEFFRQGDLERRLGLAVTPMCNRLVSKVPAIQIGFGENVVRPLFEEWHRFNPSPLSNIMKSLLEANLIEWKNKKQQVLDGLDIASPTTPVAVPVVTTTPPTLDLNDDVQETELDEQVEGLPFMQQLRRHSFPAVDVQLNLSSLVARRSSFPHTDINRQNDDCRRESSVNYRRCSLPLPQKSALFASSSSNLKNGSTHSLSIETLIGGLKVTSFSPALGVAQVLEIWSGNSSNPLLGSDQSLPLVDAVQEVDES